MSSDRTYSFDREAEVVVIVVDAEPQIVWIEKPVTVTVDM